MKRFIEIIKKKWLRDTTKTMLLITILLVALLGINAGVQKLDLQDIDITQNKLYTLSEESKKQITNIETAIKIYVIGFEEDTSLTDLIKQYQKQNETISYEIVPSVEQRTDLKSKYGITSEDTQVIILEANDRNKIISIDELYTYDYTTYQQIDISEQKITNAIVSLTIENKPVIYFLTGHNEYGITTHMTYLQAYLQNEVNEVQTLDLLVKDGIPEDASLLVIGSPQKDFTDHEVELIMNYSNQGGKLLWMDDIGDTNSVYPNVQKILDFYGVSIEQGIILEQDSNKIVLQTPNFIIPNIAVTNATKDIATDGGIMLINAGRLKFAEDEKLEELKVTSTPILTTSEKALFRTELSNSQTTKISSDEEGTYTIAAKQTKQVGDDKESELYIIANNLFVTDYAISVGSNQMPAIYFYNNKDYILNTISELTNREDTITIRKDTGLITYTATEKQDTIIRSIIFGMPAIIILIGIIVWQMRRRKK